jgi:hypothetical protein
VSLTSLVALLLLRSPQFSVLVGMRHMSGPKFIILTLTSPPPINSWVKEQMPIDFHIQDGLLFHLGHLCVHTSVCANIIWEAHYSRMAEYFGMEKTVVILQKHFYWTKLRQDVNKYIRYCTSFSIAKPSIKNKFLYNPLPTPERPWEYISMDYMYGLPSTNNDNDCVFVVVDRFSKMAIITTCMKCIKMTYTSKLFFE